MESTVPALAGLLPSLAGAFSAAPALIRKLVEIAKITPRII
jgi:hypothetical protein